MLAIPEYLISGAVLHLERGSGGVRKDWCVKSEEGTGELPASPSYTYAWSPIQAGGPDFRPCVLYVLNCNQNTAGACPFPWGHLTLHGAGIQSSVSDVHVEEGCSVCHRSGLTLLSNPAHLFPL